MVVPRQFRPWCYASLIIPNDLRGRVFSVFSLFNITLASLASGIAGIMLSSLGVHDCGGDHRRNHDRYRITGLHE